MGFLCFICLLLVGLFWFLSTQLLEPLYTTHIQKQLTEQADAIVARMDEAIGKGETLSYWAFGSRLYVNNTFFNALRDDIFELGGMSSFCIDISDTTLRQIFKVDNLSYCNLHRTRPTDTADEQTAYTTARAMRQLCRESGGTVVRKINPPTPSGSVQLMVGRMTSGRKLHCAGDYQPDACGRGRQGAQHRPAAGCGPHFRVLDVGGMVVQ